jgi:hypothetical protein
VHILCEYFGYREGKGDIRALDYSADGFTTELAPALSLPAHMSYPFLFEDSDKIYCVPETSAADEVALFRAVEFPRRWSKVAILVADFPGVDPTVFSHDGRWWLMCTRSGVQADVELWVWHAFDLLGPWTAHARNPVKSDIRGARPDGPPFVQEGVLYRPAQDCSRTYGGRIALYRVTRLTPTEFAEDLVTILEASPESPFPRGPHTLTPIGDLVLVDGRQTVFVWGLSEHFLGSGRPISRAGCGAAESLEIVEISERVAEPLARNLRVEIPVDDRHAGAGPELVRQRRREARVLRCLEQDLMDA